MPTIKKILKYVGLLILIIIVVKLFVFLITKFIA